MARKTFTPQTRSKKGAAPVKDASGSPKAGDTSAPAGAEAEVEKLAPLDLDAVCENMDCSLQKDGSLLKKSLRFGGDEFPLDGAWITMHIQGTEGEGQGFKFRLGEGRVCDAIEIVSMSMTKGERALVTCSAAADVAFFENDFKALGIMEEGKVVCVLEMTDVDQTVKGLCTLPEAQKLEFMQVRKDNGGVLFKSGNFVLALARYDNVASLARESQWSSAQSEAKAREIELLCESNRAMCFLRLGEHAVARKVCDGILFKEPSNVKALFRRAQAAEADGDSASAVGDLEKALALEPKNAEVRRALERLREGGEAHKAASSNAGDAHAATSASAAGDGTGAQGEPQEENEAQTPQLSALDQLRLKARNASLQAVKDGALGQAFQALSSGRECDEAAAKEESGEFKSKTPSSDPDVLTCLGSLETCIRNKEKDKMVCAMRLVGIPEDKIQEVLNRRDCL